MVTILSTCIEEWSGLVFIDSSLDDGKGEKLNMIKEWKHQPTMAE